MTAIKVLEFREYIANKEVPILKDDLAWGTGIARPVEKSLPRNANFESTNLWPNLTGCSSRGDWSTLRVWSPFLPRILPSYPTGPDSPRESLHSFSHNTPNRPARFQLFSCEEGLANRQFPRRSVVVKELYFQSPFLPWFFGLSSSAEWNIVPPGSVAKRYDGREVRLRVPKRKNCVSVSSSPCSDRAQWWHS